MSDIRAGTISDAAGTGPITLTGQSASKAHVKFSSTSGGGVVVQSSFNVSSITDSSVGTYVPNITSAMSSSSFPCFGGCAGNLTGLVLINSTAAQTVSMQTIASGTAFDAPVNSAVMHGDLA